MVHAVSTTHRHVLVALFAGASLAGAISAAEPTQVQAEFFEKKIRPALVQHCYACHSSRAKKIKGGLRLDSLEGVLKGGDSGPAIVPGNPHTSRLVEAIAYENIDLQMPPKGKLADSVVSDFKTWVLMGSPWPNTDRLDRAAAAASRFDLEERKRSHWAWHLFDRKRRRLSATCLGRALPSTDLFWPSSMTEASAPLATPRGQLFSGVFTSIWWASHRPLKTWKHFLWMSRRTRSRKW
jgi:hypothetical protein